MGSSGEDAYTKFCVVIIALFVFAPIEALVIGTGCNTVWKWYLADTYSVKVGLELWIALFYLGCLLRPSIKQDDEELSLGKMVYQFLFRLLYIICLVAVAGLTHAILW